MAKKDIIVIGGSAGCHSPLRQILSDLPPDLPASVFIATHVPTHTPGYLSEVLEMTSSLPVTRAVDGQAIEFVKYLRNLPNRISFARRLEARTNRTQSR